MRWKKTQSNKDGGKIFEYDLNNTQKLGTVSIQIYISSTGILSIFYLAITQGIEAFKVQHPKIIPEGMGYLRDEVTLVLKTLDNGAATVESTDPETTLRLPSLISHSVADRKKCMLDIIGVFHKNYKFPEKDQKELKQLIEASCTFLGAVKLTKSRMEKDKRFWALIHASEKSQSKAIAEWGKENVELVYGYAKNLQSAMDKLLAYASGEQISNFTVVEFEVLTEEKKYIALLKSAATWLLALHREFPNEITLALTNQPQSDDTQSYAKIQSLIGDNPEQISQSDSFTETTPLIKGNPGRVPKIEEPKKSEQDEPGSDYCFTCTIL